MNEQTKHQTYTLKIKTEFKAPVERLFKAFTTEEYMSKWWSPNENCPCSFIDINFKVGGIYRFGMKNLNTKDEYIVSGKYIEIIPNEKIVLTWCWEHEPKEKETVVQFDFKQTESGSELLLTHTKFISEKDRDEHHKGWSGIMQTLQKLFTPVQ